MSDPAEEPPAKRSRAEGPARAGEEHGRGELGSVDWEALRQHDNKLILTNSTLLDVFTMHFI